MSHLQTSIHWLQLSCCICCGSQKSLVKTTINWLTLTIQTSKIKFTLLWVRMQAHLFLASITPAINVEGYLQSRDADMLLLSFKSWIFHSFSYEKLGGKMPNHRPPNPELRIISADASSWSQFHSGTPSQGSLCHEHVEGVRLFRNSIELFRSNTVWECTLVIFIDERIGRLPHFSFLQ